MTKQAMVLVLLSAALAASCGCGVCRSVVYDPFGCGVGCDGRRCGPVCEEPCGPVCEEPCGPLRGRCGPRGAIAGPCDEGCGECGMPACGCRCRFVRGPLSFVFALFTAGSYRGCWGGCGERYWGDWYGDPPDCGDPCDCHGNFTGGGCSSCRGGEASADMAVGRIGNPSYVDGVVTPQPAGCRTCGQGGYASHARGAARYPAAYPAGAQHYAAGQPSGFQRSPAQPPNGGQRTPSSYASRGQRSPARYPSTPHSNGSYAPRLISTTDRVVKPATADQGPRLAQPQRADVVQE
jgi:hypothetical protein